MTRAQIQTDRTPDWQMLVKKIVIHCKRMSTLYSMMSLIWPWTENQFLVRYLIVTNYFEFHFVKFELFGHINAPHACPLDCVIQKAEQAWHQIYGIRREKTGGLNETRQEESAFTTSLLKKFDRVCSRIGEVGELEAMCSLDTHVGRCTWIPDDVDYKTAQRFTYCIVLLMLYLHTASSRERCL